MYDPAKFFTEPQPAAAFKLGLFARYLSVYAAKTGKYARDGEVVLWDAYAGAGRYDNGSPGSPQVALDAARRLADLSRRRQLRCLFTEANHKMFSRLDQLVVDSGLQHAVALHGRAHQHVDQVLAAAVGQPLFVLLDPFGLGLPMRDLTGTLLARSPIVNGRRIGHPTEVLLNFNFAALFRNAGHLKDKRRNERAETSRRLSLARVDKTMGGSWWHAVWQDNVRDGGYLVACNAVVDAWRDKVEKETGYTTFSVPVADKWLGAPAYHLVLITGHPHGGWVFNEACSYATRDFRDACAQMSPQLELFDPVTDLTSPWVDEIEANARHLVAAGSPCRVSDVVPQLFGRAMGTAREMHLRQALNRLHTEGLIRDRAKGPLVDFVIYPVRAEGVAQAG